MKKSLLLICAGLTLAAASCKKDDDNKTTTPTPTTPAELARGTWTWSQYGADANGNTNLDAGETLPVSSIGASGTLTINADGTGTSSGTFQGQTISGPFTWTLTDDTHMRVITDGDTSMYYIKELTTSNFTYLDLSTTPNSWYVMNK